MTITKKEAMRIMRQCLAFSRLYAEKESNERKRSENFLRRLEAAFRTELPIFADIIVEYQANQTLLPMIDLARLFFSELQSLSLPEEDDSLDSSQYVLNSQLAIIERVPSRFGSRGAVSTESIRITMQKPPVPVDGCNDDDKLDGNGEHEPDPDEFVSTMAADDEVDNFEEFDEEQKQFNNFEGDDNDSLLKTSVSTEAIRITLKTKRLRRRSTPSSAVSSRSSGRMSPLFADSGFKSLSRPHLTLTAPGSIDLDEAHLVANLSEQQQQQQPELPPDRDPKLSKSFSLSPNTAGPYCDFAPNDDDDDFDLGSPQFDPLALLADTKMFRLNKQQQAAESADDYLEVGNVDFASVRLQQAEAQAKQSERRAAEMEVERKRKEAEAELKRMEDERIRKEAQRQKRDAEKEARRKLMEDELEAERLRKQAELEAKQKKEAELDGKRLLKLSEREKRKQEREAERKIKEAEAEAERERKRIEQKQKEAEVKKQEAELEAERERKNAERIKKKAELQAERQRKEAERELKKAERKKQAEMEAERKKQAEMEAERKKEAKMEAERKKEAEMEAERKKEAKMEAERKKEAEMEAERKKQAEMEAERKKEAEMEAERKKEAKMEAERKKEAKIEAERKKQAEIEAEHDADLNQFEEGLQADKKRLRTKSRAWQKTKQDSEHVNAQPKTFGRKRKASEASPLFGASRKLLKVDLDEESCSENSDAHEDVEPEVLEIAATNVACEEAKEDLCAYSKTEEDRSEPPAVPQLTGKSQHVRRSQQSVQSPTAHQQISPSVSAVENPAADLQSVEMLELAELDKLVRIRGRCLFEDEDDKEDNKCDDPLISIDAAKKQLVEQEQPEPVSKKSKRQRKAPAAKEEVVSSSASTRPARRAAAQRASESISMSQAINNFNTSLVGRNIVGAEGARKRQPKVAPATTTASFSKKAKPEQHQSPPTVQTYWPPKQKKKQQQQQASANESASPVWRFDSPVDGDGLNDSPRKFFSTSYADRRRSEAQRLITAKERFGYKLYHLNRPANPSFNSVLKPTHNLRDPIMYKTNAPGTSSANSSKQRKPKRKGGFVQEAEVEDLFNDTDKPNRRSTHQKHKQSKPKPLSTPRRQLDFLLMPQDSDAEDDDDRRLFLNIEDSEDDHNAGGGSNSLPVPDASTLYRMVRFRGKLVALLDQLAAEYPTVAEAIARIERGQVRSVDEVVL